MLPTVSHSSTPRYHLYTIRDHGSNEQHTIKHHHRSWWSCSQKSTDSQLKHGFQIIRYISKRESRQGSAPRLYEQPLYHTDHLLHPFTTNNLPKDTYLLFQKRLQVSLPSIPPKADNISLVNDSTWVVSLNLNPSNFWPYSIPLQLKHRIRINCQPS